MHKQTLILFAKERQQAVFNELILSEAGSPRNIELSEEYLKWSNVIALYI